MNGFLLDTNVPSENVRPRPDPKLTAWLKAQKLEELYLSVITCGELRKGISSLDEGKRKTDLESWYRVDLLERFSGRILTLTQTIAERWGDLESRRQLIGRPMQVPDAQIAATALEHNLILVTRNIKHFDGIGVEIVNPWA
ncbi:MAG: type II toxin-antitoxin system VapC family toxin [Acidobacteria bacterium]|nr:type II toxin-antitoxin system VapC family toxin [Acidobacteriota bacterium]